MKVYATIVFFTVDTHKQVNIPPIQMELKEAESYIRMLGVCQNGMYPVIRPCNANTDTLRSP
jgi:hypothetical protein